MLDEVQWRKENSAACCLSVRIRRQITGVDESGLETECVLVHQSCFIFFHVQDKSSKENPTFSPGFMELRNSPRLRFHDIFF